LPSQMLEGDPRSRKGWGRGCGGEETDWRRKLGALKDMNWPTIHSSNFTHVVLLPSRETPSDTLLGDRAPQKKRGNPGPLIYGVCRRTPLIRHTDIQMFT